MNKIFGLIAILFSFSNVFSQITLQVTDVNDKEAIPFVQYSYNNVKKVSDINGFLQIDKNVSKVTLKSYGYIDTTINIIGLKDSSIVAMKNDSKMLMTVKIKPGVNPALRIINNAISNRKKNDPNSEIAYRAETYSKFVFSLDSLFDESSLSHPEKDSLYNRWSSQRKDMDNENKGVEDNKEKDEKSVTVHVDTGDKKIEDDSTSKANKEAFQKFFNSSHLMIMENASTKEFMPPFRQKETINAYKISGLNIPELANFANEIQAFSFYDNTFSLLGSTYINPIAFGATKKYSYLLQDTILNPSGDSTFVIQFFPKTNKYFDALYGQLYINSSSWAIEKVVTQPVIKKDNRMFYVKIVQDYQFVDHTKWFPKDLILELTSPAISVEDKILSGKGFTHIKSVVFNPDLKKRDFNNIVVETEQNADNVKDSEWKDLRSTPLTEKEKNTYTTIDSLAKENNLDKKLLAIQALMTGKIPAGYVNIDISKILDFNLYEGYRLGAGIETSARTSKFFKVGGYFAYGTYDKAWKYGGFLDFLLNRKNDIHATLTYHDDVVNRGSTTFETTPVAFSLNTYYNGFYVRNKETQRLAQVAFKGKAFPNLEVGIMGNYQRIWYTEGYRYITPKQILQSKIDLAEVAAEFTWTPGAKWSLMGDRYFKVEDKFPTLRLKIIKNLPQVAGNIDYWRFKLDFFHTHKIYRFGQIDWLITASKTIGETPLFLQNTPDATGGRFNLTIPNTFETMLPNTFYSSSSAAAFFRWTTESWHTRFKIFQPSISLHQAFGIGQLNNRMAHSNELTFYSLDKGYWESGIIINKILTLSNVGFGFGVFYHYGAYTQPKFGDNLTYKLSLAFGIK